RAQWEDTYMLPMWIRVPLFLVGVFLVWFSFQLFVDPPTREVRELMVGPASESYTKTTTSADGSTTVVMGVFAVSIGCLVWAIIGVRYPKFEGLDYTTPPGPLADSPPAQKIAVEAHQQADPPSAVSGQVGDNAVHTFLLRSSWNGLLVLKACQVSKDKQKALNLRELCALLGMSYDYAFGYFIATFSADVLAGVADPTTGITRVFEINQVLREKIDEIIQGNLAVSAALEPRKKADLGKLTEYLAKL
ncbi:MAG TPA: hypothetical protein PLG56_03515, partial [Lacunisphaera sp.]|nr:hypothetical protein [Lacunisphaera sp.]